MRKFYFRTPPCKFPAKGSAKMEPPGGIFAVLQMRKFHFRTPPCKFPAKGSAKMEPLGGIFAVLQMRKFHFRTPLRIPTKCENSIFALPRVNSRQKGVQKWSR
ncbi:Uncharacterized protein dnm_094700 [Desulfonema magnum]|uniref:Uncharacterized protein n=1 Tax=Desulfonema magnum TaxID=45655 RepID=A0A975BYG7_9BACT|nr:Uncharacterized protein dnm_094700 [Desulfonema magnum]